jgi:hypothetical protein
MSLVMVAVGALALASGLFLLARRNENEVAERWTRLFSSPTRALEARLKVAQLLEARRAKRLREEVRAGRVLGAAGIEAEGAETPRERRRKLSMIRRMLTAR